MADWIGVDVQNRSDRQHPGAAAMMELLGDGNPLLGEVLMELNHLSRYGVEITKEMAVQAVRTVQERHRPQPVAVQTAPADQAEPKRRAAHGRFSKIANVGPVVYYVRIGNRVKIGTSTNLRDRLEAINPEELMALEAGDARLERLRHRQFADLRTHGEWFRLEGALRDHIEALRAAA